MTPKLKDKWTAALRSGKYPQGFGQLSFKDGSEEQFVYCCLGVLHEVAGGKWITNGPRSNGEIAQAIEYENEYGLDLPSNREDILPKILLDEYGLTEKDQDKLVQLNDIERLDFKQIADWIDEHIGKETAS